MTADRTKSLPKTDSFILFYLPRTKQRYEEHKSTIVMRSKRARHPLVRNDDIAQVKGGVGRRCQVWFGGFGFRMALALSLPLPSTSYASIYYG